MSSTEFVKWMVYIEELPQERTKEEYYLARIAMEVKHIGNMLAQKREALSIDSMLLPFKVRSPDKKAEDKKSAEHAATLMELNKQRVWAKVTGASRWPPRSS